MGHSKNGADCESGGSSGSSSEGPGSGARGLRTGGHSSGAFSGKKKNIALLVVFVNLLLIWFILDTKYFYVLETRVVMKNIPNRSAIAVHQCVELPLSEDGVNQEVYSEMFVAALIADAGEAKSCLLYRVRPGDDWWTITKRFPWMDTDEVKKYNFKSGSSISEGEVLVIPTPEERNKLAVAFWRTGLLNLIMHSDGASTNESTSTLKCKVPVVVPGDDRIWLPHEDVAACSTDGPPVFSFQKEKNGKQIVQIDLNICSGKEVFYRFGPSPLYNMGDYYSLNNPEAISKPKRRGYSPLQKLDLSASDFVPFGDSEYMFLYCRSPKNPPKDDDSIDAEANTWLNLHVRNSFSREISLKDVRNMAIKNYPFLDTDPKSHNSASLNIIMVVFDTVARAHFLRQMPTTTSYLEDLHLSEEYELFQFLGLNVIGRGTYVNTGAYYSGTPVGELTKESERDKWIFTELAELGYVTSYVSDIGYANAMWSPRTPFRQAADIIDYFSWTTHHKLLSPFLHPSLPLYSGSAVSDRGRWCFAGKENHEYVLKYIKEFHSNYDKAHNFHFSVTHINGPHDKNMRMLKNYDNDFQKLLKELKDEGILAKSALLIVGDHGTQRGKYYTSDAGQMEYRMPASFLLLPKHFLERYPEAQKALTLNQQRLVTPYDFHETLLHIAHLPHQRPPQNYTTVLADRHTFEYNNGTSKPPRRPTHFPFAMSLLQEVPSDRNCEQANIPDWWCSCTNWITHNLTTADDMETASKIANAVIQMLNELSGNGKGNCLKLELHTVKSFMTSTLELRKGNTNLNWDMAYGSDKYNRTSYKIVIATTKASNLPQKPNVPQQQKPNAVFEAMIIDMETGEHVVTSAIRLSTWGQETCDKKDYSPEYCVCDASSLSAS